VTDLRQLEIRNRLLERLERNGRLLLNEECNASWIEDEAHEGWDNGRRFVWSQRVKLYGREMWRVNNDGAAKPR
jgi:hypothetical protein